MNAKHSTQQRTIQMVHSTFDNSSARWLEISDRVWSYAEVGLQEYQSASLLSTTLEEAGFNVSRGLADMPTAFVAEWTQSPGSSPGSGPGAPVVAILGEFDALPGLSQAVDTEQRPIVPGAPGYGCGHNLLVVAGVAAAVAVREAMEEAGLEGTIRYYGCPAEETLVGKVFMVREGLFSDVDIALTWHSGDVNAVREGSTAALISTRFRFYGRAAHAAGSPESGRSALDAVELLNIGANYLREHVPSTTRIHYVITNGGSEPNIVPPEAEVWYYVRAPLFEEVQEVYQRLQKIAEGAALMTETQMEERFLTGCHNSLHNQVIGDIYIKNMREIGPPQFSQEEIDWAKGLRDGYAPQQLRSQANFYQRSDWAESLVLHQEVGPLGTDVKDRSGSTEVGDVSWVVPLAQFSTTCQPFGTPGHSWQVTASVGGTIGHKGMLYAGKILALTALDFMADRELVEAARADLRETLARRHYQSPLPEGLKVPLDQLSNHK